MQSGKYKRVSRGQPIYRVNEPCATLYVVLSGRVGVHGANNLPVIIKSKGRVGRERADLPSGLDEEAFAKGDDTSDDPGVLNLFVRLPDSVVLFEDLHMCADTLAPCVLRNELSRRVPAIRYGVLYRVSPLPCAHGPH